MIITEVTLTDLEIRDLTECLSKTIAKKKSFRDMFDRGSDIYNRDTREIERLTNLRTKLIESIP